MLQIKLCSIVDILPGSCIQLIEIFNNCCKIQTLYWCHEKFNTILFIFYTLHGRIYQNDLLKTLFQIHEIV